MMFLTLAVAAAESKFDEAVARYYFKQLVAGEYHYYSFSFIQTSFAHSLSDHVKISHSFVMISLSLSEF